MRKIPVLIVLVVIVISSIAVYVKRGKQAPSTLGTLKGVSLSPKSFQSADFTDFFEKAKQVGEIVSWAGDCDELSNTQSGGPTVVASFASTYGYIPLVEAQFFTQSSGMLLRPLDNTTKQNYRESAVAFADRYKPKYLAIGIEVNILSEKSPSDFDDFVPVTESIPLQ